MNSLSLRVSSVKTGENVKKNAEMRTSLMNLPMKYKNRSDTFVKTFTEATSIQSQVDALKKIYEETNEDRRQTVLFLADLYFYGPTKHPVRNQIVKLLQKETESADDVLLQLQISLQNYVQEFKSNSSSCTLNEIVNSLIGCFDNFKIALKALEKNLDTVFPFLCDSIEKYFEDLRFQTSPSAKNEYFLYIHNSTRLILSCIQEFAFLLRSRHASKLDYLNDVSNKIIDHIDIPMDTKSNAGILMAYIARNFDEYDSFVLRALNAKAPSDIALCVGVVNTFTNSDFERIPCTILKVVSTISDIAKTNASIPNILLCTSRVLFQMSKLILSLDINKERVQNDIKSILKVLLAYTFCYMDHHMDSVRHTSREILRNVIKAANVIHDENLISDIFCICISNNNSLLIKSVVLLQVSAVLGTAKVLLNCPNIFSELFEPYLGLDIQVNNLFEGLMLNNHNEVAFEEWRNLWVIYLLKMVTIKDIRMPDIESLIKKSIKCDCRVVNYIIEENNSLPISTKLLALWTFRKNGMDKKNFSKTLQNFSDSFEDAIVSDCDETRIMALRLLVESHKTTEHFSKLECKYILKFIKYNANTQSPATRQKAMGLLTKGLDRFDLNVQQLMKSQQKNDHFYITFFIDLINMLGANLFPGANFSRRSVSLQLLKKVIDIGIRNKLDLKEILNVRLLTNIVNNLEDTYEANTALTVIILKSIENYYGQKISNSITIEKIKNKLISVRPTDSVSAAYSLDYFCNSLDSKEAMLIFNVNHEPKYKPVEYSSIRWTMNILNNGLDMAKDSILIAAKLNPLYGSCFTIKHLLSELDFYELSKFDSWRSLIADLIILCKELTKVVGPIVNSSSPEGHLPNDFSEFPESLNDLINDEIGTSFKILSKKITVDKNNLKITPQMVLICAWRTVKDVSLILGALVLRSPIKFHKSTSNFLVTIEQIVGIGDHFKELLSETKHRGAFEQAYVGFSKLCSRLWRVDCLALNELPNKWLQELLEIISKDNKINEKICATRRSAGVPFMVQALITSELQVGTAKSLKYCMHHLLKLSSDLNRSTESRTHALNILRALFRCSDLNEVIGEFISEGVRRAINGYEANDWSEKNSSTLLFASLITRIFGVQIAKDYENLNIRNKMTGRIFFLRYPELYDYFLDELKKASALVLCNQKANKLHPLLLILSRLYPSALEGTASNLKLSEFIPFVAICSGSHEMQTRFLAAKSIVALILVDNLPKEILYRCKFIMPIENRKAFPFNVMHGHLLQIYYLLKSLSTVTKELVGFISLTLSKIHSSITNNNAVIVKITLDILIEILKRLSSLDLSVEVIQNISYFSRQQHFYKKEFNFHYPVLQKSLFLYNLHLLRLTLPTESIIDLLLSPPYEEQVCLEQTEVQLNIILFLVNTTECEGNIIEEFELSQNEIDFLKALDSETKLDLQLELRKNKTLKHILERIIENKIYYPECTTKAYAIFSQLTTSKFSIIYLIKQTSLYPGDMKNALAMCVKRLVKDNLNDVNMAEVALEYLQEISRPWYPDALRFYASEILCDISVHFENVFKTQNKKFIQDFIKIAFELIMDDCSEVRKNTSKIVLLLKCKQKQLKEDNIVSIYAIELFLQHIADTLRKIKADNDFITFVYELINDLANSEENYNKYENSDVDIFDKNEANVFAEMHKVSKYCFNIFQDNFKHIRFDAN